jgi:hypothetical protein
MTKIRGHPPPVNECFLVKNMNHIMPQYKSIITLSEISSFMVAESLGSSMCLSQSCGFPCIHVWTDHLSHSYEVKILRILL